MESYMRKAKLTGDVVAVMEVSQSSLGVRTRAKTLALQKLQASKTATAPPPEHDGELLYLQLRSHRLEKPPLQQSTCYRQQNPNPTMGGSRLATCLNQFTYPIFPAECHDIFLCKTLIPPRNSSTNRVAE